MGKFLSVLSRILLAQIFLLQVGFLVYSFVNSPTGYLDYQNELGHHGLPGIFAPLIILIQAVGGLTLFLGYKTKAVAIFMTIYIVFITVSLGLPPLQYLAIAGGLLALASNGQYPLSLDSLKKSA